MKSKTDKQWNSEVESQIKKLLPVRKWLQHCVNTASMDWESQKSAHQALKLLEMAEYEMWNMQWMSRKEQKLYLKAEKSVN